MAETITITGKRCAELDEIKAQVYLIVEKFNPKKIILFGSYANGKPTQESDVDLLIIIETNQSTWELSAKIASSVKHFFPMDIIVKTPEEVTRRLKYGDFFIEDITKNGKVLYERTGKRMD